MPKQQLIQWTMKKNQLTIFNDTSRFIVFSTGRRFGKTHLVVRKCTLVGINKCNALCHYIGPTYGMAKDLAWPILNDILPKEYIASINKTDLTVVLKNKSVIQLKSAEIPDRLRGPGLDFVGFDETAFMKKEAWLAVRPSLSDKKGCALFASSPFGYNWFYDLCQKAKEYNANGRSWNYYTFTTIDGGYVSSDEIEEAKNDLDEKTFNREYLASFESLAGRVYYAFDRKHNVINSCPFDINKISTILVGMDFNVDPMCAVIGLLHNGALYIINEIVLHNSNTDEMCVKIRNTYKNKKIIIFPDPTGKRRQTSAKMGETDFTKIREHGFMIYAPNVPYNVADKINCTNTALKNVKGDVKIFILNNIKNLIYALDGYLYNDKGEPNKNLGLDHITDALAYLVCYVFPIFGKSKLVEIGAR